MKKLINPSNNELKTIVNELKKEDVILHYTGNMIGIGTSAYYMDAIKKIDYIKGREKKKSYIVLIPDIESIEKYKFTLSKKMLRVVQQYSPGNVTYVIRNNSEKLKHLNIEGKVAVRIPEDHIIKKFIKYLGEHVISTSVNKSGENYINDVEKIEKIFGRDIDYAILPKEKNVEGAPSTIVEESENGLICIRNGSVEFGEIKKSYENPNIIFVCTGNTCRSPIAEYLFRELSKRKRRVFRSISAGFISSNEKISENSRIVLKEHGIDASNHRSQMINNDLIRKSWLILTMGIGHKEKLNSLFSNASDKIYTLSEYVGMDGDIDDPYMKNLDTYRKTYDEIACRIRKLIEKI